MLNLNEKMNILNKKFGAPSGAALPCCAAASDAQFNKIKTN
jgi:hypothetical protein